MGCLSTAFVNEILKLQGLEKWVGTGEGRLPILKGVSLVLHQSEFIAIMGASGSGKSTLLHIMGLLDVPSAGSLTIFNQDAALLTEDKAAAMRAQHIGFVFQSFHLLPYLTARENIELPMSYRHQVDVPQRAGNLLSQMHLESRAEAYPSTLSGGERQRVAIARALANGPSLILADEPTGALDSRTGAQIMGLITDLHHQGAAVVLVTHDEAIARRAQKVLTMRDGQFV